MYRRNHTYGSCSQQPTRTVTIGHGSPPFRRAAAVTNVTGTADPSALPNRRGDRSRVTAGGPWEATRVATGRSTLVSGSRIVKSAALALYYPPPGSFPRQRLAGNCRPSRSASEGRLPAARSSRAADFEIYAGCARKVERATEFFAAGVRALHVLLIGRSFGGKGRPRSRSGSRRGGPAAPG